MRASIRLGLKGFLIFMTIVTGSSVQAYTELQQAEYALRWDPREGGPKTAEATLNLLGLQVGVPDHYEIRYYDLIPPSSAPPQATVILRERQKLHGKPQFRLKYRLTEPLTQPWRCPPGSNFEQDSEVDVTWLGANTQKRVYAYSCSMKANQPPPSLGATPKPCSAKMVRYESKGLKVESWHMPDGSFQLEVSRSAANDIAAFRSFQEIAVRLLAQGVKPTDSSKTEQGSRCP